MKKTEIISIRNFMDGNYGKVKARRDRQAKKAKRSRALTMAGASAAIPAGIVSFETFKALFAATPALAAEATAKAAEASIQMRIANAFEPSIDLAQGVSYPLALIMIIGGCLFIMVGNKEKGFSMIQAAGIGYVLCQIAPLIMGLLVDIAGAL